MLCRSHSTYSMDWQTWVVGVQSKWQLLWYHTTQIPWKSLFQGAVDVMRVCSTGLLVLWEMVNAYDFVAQGVLD